MIICRLTPVWDEASDCDLLYHVHKRRVIRPFDSDVVACVAAHHPVPLAGAVGIGCQGRDDGRLHRQLHPRRETLRSRACEYGGGHNDLTSGSVYKARLIKQDSDLITRDSQQQAIKSKE